MYEQFVDAHIGPWYPKFPRPGARASIARHPPPAEWSRACAVRGGERDRRPGRGAFRLRAIGMRGLASASMDLFVSHVTMRLDAKGRISVPASFRAALARDGYEGLYVHPSLDRPALDAGGHALTREIEALLSHYDPFSEIWEVFSTALHGESEQLKIDGEGRVQLSERLKARAFIAEEATFVGLGHKFQIWEPERFAAHRSEATEKVRAFRRELGSRPPSGARDR